MKSIISLLFLFVFFLGESGCRLKNNPPELISLSVKEAKVSDEITLTGHQFGSTPVVLFGTGTSAVSASIRSNDDNSIRVKIPYVSPGLTQIRVQNDQGTTDPLPFTVLQPSPQVLSITPTNGLPGTSVVITGDFLNQIKRVQFGSIDAVISDSTAQKLTVLVPPKVVRGPSSLVIETQGGLFTNSFIVAGNPQITSLSPLKTKPGAALVIKGVNLSDGIVRVNGKPTDKSLTTITDTEIHTIIPAEATSGQVTVTVFDKLIATSTDTLQIFQTPIIERLSAQEAIGGDKLLINGRNLSAVSNVTFNNFIATFRVLSDTQIEAIVPNPVSSGSFAVSVSSIGGSNTGAEPVFIYLAPSVILATPTRQLREKLVTISGTNLYRITDVRFNNISASISSRTEGTTLVVTVPANAVSGPVTVINRAGSAVTTTPFVVIQKAIVSSVLPLKAQVGQLIAIKGDFLQDAQIFFSGSFTAAVDDGKNTDTERWVIVPKEAKTGPLRIVNATNDATETAIFTVLP